MELQQILKKIGLSDKEAKVYLAVLELGESTVLPISKKSGFKRTYCYDILSGLVEKNLVSFVIKNGRRRYKAEDPKKIHHRLNNHLILYESVLPQLNSLYNTRVGGKPKVSFYEGVKEIFTLYEQIIGAKQLDAIASPLHIEKYIGKYFNKILDKAFTKDLILRELMPQSSTLATYQKSYIKPYHEYRFLSGITELKTDMMLFENKLVLVSYGETPHAVVIEDSSIVQTQRILFNIIWNASKPD